jgi:hypothetical protein
MRLNNTQTNYFYGNSIFQGGLSALSGTTFTNTIFTTTSALSVINTGIGPALYVAQAPGDYDIASFYDKDGIEVLHIGNAPVAGTTGKVGINESNPGAELTVKGAISASGSLSAFAADGSNHFLAGSLAAGTNTRATGTRSTAIGLYSSATATGAMAFGRYASASNSRTFVWQGKDTTIPFSSTRADQFAISANGGAYLVGNVGINTDANDQALTVVGTISTNNHKSSSDWNSVYTSFNTQSAANASVYTTTNTNSANWILQNGNTFGGAMVIGTNDSFSISVKTNGAQRLLITNTNHRFYGNVSMGTGVDSSERLTVNGNISANGTVYASNKWVYSDPSLVPSSPAPSAITNIVTLSQAAYNALGSYSSTTLYIIV